MFEDVEIPSWVQWIADNKDGILETLKLTDKKVLIVVKELEENLILASRNIENVLLITADEVNVLDLVATNNVLITEDAVKAIEEVLA